MTVRDLILRAQAAKTKTSAEIDFEAIKARKTSMDSEDPTPTKVTEPNIIRPFHTFTHGTPEDDKNKTNPEITDGEIQAYNRTMLD